MGLAMYLYKETCVQQWPHQLEEDAFKITITKGGKPFVQIKPERITTIKEEVGYWRKANAVHNWFVDNVQDGNDDCKRYWVSKEDLQKLLDVVNKALKNPSTAHEYLPTVRGFFFGSQDYDEYYFKDLRYTKEMLTELLNELLKEDTQYTDIYYESSW